MSPVEVAELVRSARAGEPGRGSRSSRATAASSGPPRVAHRLSDADAADVFQTTWMRLLEHLDDLRNPEALGGWLATTARNECLRVLRGQSRVMPTEDDRLPQGTGPRAGRRPAARRGRDAALWRAFPQALGPLSGAAADALRGAPAELRRRLVCASHARR